MSDYQDENEEIKDLLKKKVKLSRDSSRPSDLGDVLFRIGYLYYQKGYYTEAMSEFENALDVRKKVNINLDIATTYRFLGETLCKLGTDFERAKKELDMYYSITLNRLKDLVEIQRAETTLGNYYMALYEINYQDNKKKHLNEAYSYYLKSYDILNEISEKRLVDSKEFALMKARTCFNCAFAMDEKRDFIICNEYLKTAIDICEKNHFYEDLIRCYYIKCDQAKRKNKMEETLRIADKLIEISSKSKDHVQQSNDFLFVTEIYLKIQNFDKAKTLLRKAYKLRKKCLINPDILDKLKQVIDIIHLNRELNGLDPDLIESISGINLDLEKSLKILKIYEKLGDNLCNLSLYELGLKNYQKQLEMAKKLNRPNSELALIYSSLSETCQDLNDLNKALEYYDLEIKTNSMDSETECKSLLNIAIIKEKLSVEFNEIKDIYMKAYRKAKEIVNNETSLKLQLKAMNLLKETEITYMIQHENETQKIINSLNEIIKIRNLNINDDDETSQDKESVKEDDENEDDNDESILFSSESEEDEIVEDDNEIKITKKSKTKPKRYVVKRNLRGETHLHVACIKGNFKMAKKLLEEGHPVNERDNLNWLPIHEASNYGHVELVELLIKYGAKVNDHIGPITPLHDASQNGHFEVVKLLLKAGAMTYVFSQDGYTPLDYLCHYRETNKNKITYEEMDLFKEIYDIMSNDIRAKDKCYKIKRVSIENNLVPEEEDVEMTTEEKKVEKSTSDYKFNNSKSNLKKKSVNYGLDDLSDKSSDSESDSNVPKISKKKAVSEYKDAINCFGRKNLNGTKSFTGKKAVDKVIVTETEYNINVNDWLINDIEKKATATTSSSTKRKLKDNLDEMNIDNDLSNLSFEHTEAGHNNDDDDYDNEILDHDLKSKKSNSKRSAIISPISKRRNIENTAYNSDAINKRSLDLFDNDNDSQSSSSSLVLSNFNNNNNKINEAKANNFKKSKDTSRSLEILLDSENDENSITNKENDFKIKSPFKSNNKTQMKLTKMLNYTNNNAKQQTTSPSGVEIVEVVKNKTEKVKTQASNESEAPKVSWKIKATIDNRNFLIPISNIYATIDDLTVQIVTRYKTIFSNDSQYREPEKIILKSSDDLILFGEDLIKDVLSDQCQVKLVIETYKDAPSISELYEKTCLSNNLTVYSNIKQLLNESESCLDLKSVSIDQINMPKQFEIIFETIKLSSKQQFANNDYFINLNKIDLSNNYLNDQIVTNFIEVIFPECINLKSLNLSSNQITHKSLKTLCDLANSNKFSNKSYSMPLEFINMNDNDIGLMSSNCDILLIMNNILTLFQSLKMIHFSNCKISFDENLNNENSWKRFLSTVKTSKLTDIDFSYNTISAQCFSDLIESLPDYQIESINFNSCLKKNNVLRLETSSLNKFIGYTLRSLSLRNLNLKLDQCSELIKQICSTCKQLKHIDLSYNSFDNDSIQNLFTECLKLEEANLINNDKCDINWMNLIRFKFDQNNSVLLKRIELKIENSSEKIEIVNIFKNKWQKNFIKTFFLSKDSIGIKVDY